MAYNRVADIGQLHIPFPTEIYGHSVCAVMLNYTPEELYAAHNQRLSSEQHWWNIPVSSVTPATGTSEWNVNFTVSPPWREKNVTSPHFQRYRRVSRVTVGFVCNSSEAQMSCVYLYWLWSCSVSEFLFLFSFFFCSRLPPSEQPDKSTAGRSQPGKEGNITPPRSPVPQPRWLSSWINHTGELGTSPTPHLFSFGRHQHHYPSSSLLLLLLTLLFSSFLASSSPSLSTLIYGSVVTRFRQSSTPALIVLLPRELGNTERSALHLQQVAGLTTLDGSSHKTLTLCLRAHLNSPFTQRSCHDD